MVLLGSNSHCLLLFTETGDIRLLKDPPHSLALKIAVLTRCSSFGSVVFAITLVVSCLSQWSLSVMIMMLVGVFTPGMFVGLGTKRQFIL